MAEASFEPPSDRDPAAIARAVAGLAVIGASVALALQQLAGDWTRGFVTSNAISPLGRRYLLVSMLVGAVLGAASAALLGLRRRADAARLSRVAHRVAPLALTALVPGLLAIDPWTEPLILALSLAAFLLAAEPLFRLSFTAALAAPVAPSTLTIRLRNWIGGLPMFVRRYGPVAAVLAAALGYALYMAIFAIRNHHKFGTYTWDLSHLDNEFWNALHGRPFRNTLMFREGNWANVRNHFQPTIFALLPFYALVPRAETLLALQAAIVGAGAIPLYRFAARRLSRGLALLLALAYLLYPPTHGAQLFDFHFQPIAAALLLAALDAFDDRRPRVGWPFLLLAIGCREDVSAATAMIGLLLLLLGRRSRLSLRTRLAIFVVSVSYFVAVRFVIMPLAGSFGFADLYKGLFPEGQASLAGVVTTLVTNPLYVLRTLLVPDKLRYALQILLPLAFLPLRRPVLALLLLPGCFFTLLTTDYAPTVEIFFHYSPVFVPYAFAGATLALAHIGAAPDGKVRLHAAAATLAVATLLATTAWGAFPPRRTLRSSYGWFDFGSPTAEQRQRRRDVDDLNAMVPKTAILAVSDREAPHVSNRYECWSLSAGFQGADYVLFSTVNPIAPDTEMAAAAERAGFVRIAVRSGLVLLARPGLSTGR